MWIPHEPSLRVSHDPGVRTDSPVPALDAVRHAPTIVGGMRLGVDLIEAAGNDSLGSSLPDLVEAVVDRSDDLAAIAAVHALGALPGGVGQPTLLALFDGDARHLREHAAWAVGAGPPMSSALGPLVEMVAGGEFAGMLAQRTLESWVDAMPDAVAAAVEERLRTADDASARSRLVETLGLVPGWSTTHLLLARAVDQSEAPGARAAAVAALGDDPSRGEIDVVPVLAMLAAGDEPLADTARAALHDLRRVTLRGRDGRRSPAGRSVVQLFLHADIDAALSHSGRGDTGGIATLLVHLGDSLVARDGATTRTVTVSRGRPADGTTGLDALVEPGHHYASVPLWGPPVSAADAWPLRVAARRGIRRILRAAHPVDVLHLRMADVGSLAAAEAADELGVPVVFTLAPDPHAQVGAREAAGTLTRADFGEADHVEHLVFRDHLLRSLTARAAHLVLFPRPDLRRDLRELLGVELTVPGVRASVVAEGVDLAGIRRAATAVAAAQGDGGLTPQALTDLDGLLETLPPERRQLPLAITVGRLHPVKGMASLIETWAVRTDLTARCNLLVVGGDLDMPTAEEAMQLERIRAAVPPEDAARRGLLLAGHRPNAVVAAWMAATRLGRRGLAAPHGVYVSASLKEEFGIAILEAMASGLVVVAPAAGGPATYVEDGVTGVLVDTTSADALAGAVRRALALARDVEATARADAARSRLRDRFGIETMAATLDEVYGRVATTTWPSRRVPSPSDGLERTQQRVTP